MATMSCCSTAAWSWKPNSVTLAVLLLDLSCAETSSCVVQAAASSDLLSLDVVSCSSMRPLAFFGCGPNFRPSVASPVSSSSGS